MIWTLAGLYLAVTILVNLPFVQSALGSEVAKLLSRKLGTCVLVGRVDLGLLNRVIVDDVRIQDQKGHQMLLASRLSVSVDYMELMQGRVSVSSAQLFGLQANLYRATATAVPNYQFMLDSLKSKNPSSKSTLDLSIGSLIIRHGAIRYDQLDAPRLAKLDARHLSLSDISGHLVLYRYTPDSLNVFLKTLSMKERSGADLRELSLRFVANKTRASLTDFSLELPHSRLHTDAVTATYRFEEGKLSMPTLQFDGSLTDSYVYVKDLAFLSPALQRYDQTAALSTSFSGTSTQLKIKRLETNVVAGGHTTTPIAHVLVSGFATNYTRPSVSRWLLNIEDLSWNEEALAAVKSDVPDVIARLGRLRYRGRAGGAGGSLYTRGRLSTAVGTADVMVDMKGRKLSAEVETGGFDLQRVLDDSNFGQLAAHLSLTGNLATKMFTANGTIDKFTYQQYDYRNIVLNGTYGHQAFDGHLSINDPNVKADFTGSVDLAHPKADLSLAIDHILPSALLRVPAQWHGRSFSGTLTARMAAPKLNRSILINEATGKVSLNNFTMSSGEGEYHLDSLLIVAQSDQRGHHLSVASDFAHLWLNGRFDYATFIQSVENLVIDRLPGIQQLTPVHRRAVSQSEFDLSGTITRSDWARIFFGIPIELHEPVTLTGNMSAARSSINADIQAPSFTYGGHDFEGTRLQLVTAADTLKADLTLARLNEEGRPSDFRLMAAACNDELSTVVQLDNHAPEQRLHGTLRSVTRLYREDGEPTTAEVNIRPSEISIGDTVLQVSPARVIYQRNRLAVDHLVLSRGGQRITVNGIASASANDSLLVGLHNVNVPYILELVNFHTVSFGGAASGQATVKQIFSKPQMSARLRVDDFHFEDGYLGTLFADAGWNDHDGRIEIQAQAVDSTATDPKGRRLDINGWVSPPNNTIDLTFAAHHTRAEFLKGFTSAFLEKINANVTGELRLAGTLSHPGPNLTGQMVATGSLGVKALNTVYTLQNDTINFGYNQIVFPGCRVTDVNGAEATIWGSLYHKHLSDISFDLNVKANNLLAYDFDGSDGSAFYGHVLATGDIHLQGGDGQVNIDVKARPEAGSRIVYNASSPESLSQQDFITWHDRDSLKVRYPSVSTSSAHPHPDEDEAESLRDLSSDIRLNLMIDAQPDATLRVVMDQSTGDYIDLNGSGVLRASYYNKGGVELYGNYLIDHGVYKLTVQNIIRRVFEFQQGGTIAFGGNPMDAALNLKALYTVNSVSLSDLQLGQSFANNNIRVDCLMDITGTPQAPRISFSLDMPTVGTDAKQMIMSLLNSEEEMNQQVIYLLAVGRFYQSTNNYVAAENGSQSQTTLAMQSLLSGQLSQQVNNILSTVIHNSNWNFGANISTGDEGWNNAEYEGLLSGRLLNNRLLINGQFGYRDKATSANTSFIGDFDIRYLIFPSGNFSVRVYNQTNDRYFTRNSLTTQGLGLILKKDFTSLRDLFSIEKKKKKK